MHEGQRGSLPGLLDAGRPNEALDWVREPLLRSGGHGHASRFERPTPARLLLEARILRALDCDDEATGLLWQGFAETLDADLLRAHLKALPDSEDSAHAALIGARLQRQAQAEAREQAADRVLHIGARANRRLARAQQCAAFLGLAALHHHLSV